MMQMRPEFQAELDQTFAALAQLKQAVERHFGAPAQITHLARDITYLPIWKNGHRPDWWGDVALRNFVTASHRQMTLAQCCADAAARFETPISKSSLQRYWALLDGVLANQSSNKEAA